MSAEVTVKPSWEVLLDNTNILRFLKRLEKDGVGAEGCLTKLDNLETAVKFVRKVILRDNHKDERHAVCTKIEETIGDYKCRLRKVKSKKIEPRLEALSETPLDPQEVTDVLECKAMWSDFRDVVEQVKRGRGTNVAVQDLNRCSLAIGLTRRLQIRCYQTTIRYLKTKHNISTFTYRRREDAAWMSLSIEVHAHKPASSLSSSDPHEERCGEMSRQDQRSHQHTGQPLKDVYLIRSCLMPHLLTSFK